MKIRNILIGAVVVVIGLPVVLAVITWGAFYALVSSYAPNRTNGTIVSSGEKREYLLYVDTLEATYNIDPTRIYANGMSNGGALIRSNFGSSGA
jgi:poly(3-hydroxybutyrate) depolymerase